MPNNLLLLHVHYPFHFLRVASPPDGLLYIERQRTFNWWTDGEDKNRSLPGLIYKLLLWEALPLASQYAPAR